MWVRKENTLTKRLDLKHTRYAHKPGVQYPPVKVAIRPHVFYGPEGRTLRNHDMVDAERRRLNQWARGPSKRMAGRCWGSNRHSRSRRTSLGQPQPRQSRANDPHTDIFPSNSLKFFCCTQSVHLLFRVCSIQPATLRPPRTDYETRTSILHCDYTT